MTDSAFNFSEEEINGKPFQTWGQFNWSAFYQNWERGQRPVPFDENIHDIKNRAIFVKFSITPLSEMNLNPPYEKESPANKPVARVPVKSAMKLGRVKGRNTSSLCNAWCLVESVLSGEKYQKKNDDGSLMFDENNAPVIVNKQTYKFISFFDTENECRADYFATTGKSADDVVTTEKPSAPAPAVTSSPRDNALKFAQKIVENAYTKSPDDVTTFITEQFKKFPLVGNHLSVEDEDVQEMIMNEGLK